MHFYRCVVWQQTSYISVILLGADLIENSFPPVEVCLPIRCLATLWPPTLQHYYTSITIGIKKIFTNSIVAEKIILVEKTLFLQVQTPVTIF
jgi:hypothetical protein